MKKYSNSLAVNFEVNHILNNNLKDVIERIKPTNCEVSCTIIDLSNSNPVLIGYNQSKYIYPASVIKVFIAAEVLRQIEIGLLSFEQTVIIERKNVVGDSRGIHPTRSNEENLSGAEVSIDWLLEAMLAESSNTASNVLIDLVTREMINKNIIYACGWKGSEITRKFLSREKEDTEYKLAPMTMSCSLHLAEFCFLVESNKMISEFVSKYLKRYMLKCTDRNNISLSIPIFNSYYHKIGSVETNLWSYGIKNAYKKIIRGKWRKERWQNDAGTVSKNNLKYAICVLSHNKTFTNKLFPMKLLSQEVLTILESHSKV